VTLLKYGNGGYLAWRVQFWGRKRAYTLLNVYLIARHLVEFSELQLTYSSCPIVKLRVLAQEPLPRGLKLDVDFWEMDFLSRFCDMTHASGGV
jgi:hypothetical protein